MAVNLIVFFVGLLIYAGLGIPGLIYLVSETLVAYLVGRFIPRHRWFMWVSVAFHAAVILAVKLNAAADWGLLVPIGVSYVTLQIISYHVDIYRGKYEPERDMFRFALFLTYYPHLAMGPIGRWDDWDRQIDGRRITWRGVAEGGTRALWGLCKQLIIGARAAAVVGTISGDADAYKGAYVLLAVLLYSVRLYADFSGAMDIVLGVSKMLGIELKENFDRPYFSETVKEFWRRWHITLGSWLKDYVYIPLGGSRKGKARKVLNTVITFLVSGLWHGVHYIVWGALNGLLVCLGDKTKTPWKWLNRVITFVFITLLWAFFVWPDTMTALRSLGSLFTTFNYGEAAGSIATLGLDTAQWIIFGAGAAALWLGDIFRERIMNGVRGKDVAPAVFLAAAAVLALLVMTLGVYGIGFNASAFIYSRF